MSSAVASPGHVTDFPDLNVRTSRTSGGDVSVAYDTVSGFDALAEGLVHGVGHRFDVEFEVVEREDEGERRTFLVTDVSAVADVPVESEREGTAD